MKKVFALLLLLPCVLAAQEVRPVEWSTFVKQKALYFTSDHVTIAGLGGGLGMQAVWNGWLVSHADVCVLWGNGNVVPVQVAVGVQREGRWSPAAFATFSLLAGQRTETLTRAGERPAVPSWAVGVLLAPLRFEAAWGTPLPLSSEPGSVRKGV